MWKGFLYGALAAIAVNVLGQTPSHAVGVLSAFPDWLIGVGLALLLGGVVWYLFIRKPDKGKAVVAAVEAHAPTVYADLKKDADEGWDHVVALAHKAADTAKILASKVPDAVSPVATAQNGVEPPQPTAAPKDTAQAAGAQPAPVPQAGSAKAPMFPGDPPVTLKGATAMQKQTFAPGAPFTAFPDNPTHDVNIEWPFAIRYFSGAAEWPDGTWISPPTPPAFNPATDPPSTVMQDFWTKNPAWGSGPDSWNKARDAAIAAAGGSGQPARNSLPLPTGGPDAFIVSKYVNQGSALERAAFYEDNQAILSRYRWNLPDIDAVGQILGRNLGSLSQRQYEADTNTYFLNGRPLSSYTLAELGLDK